MDKRGLAASARPRERDQLAGSESHRYIAEYRGRPVADRNSAKLDSADSGTEPGHAVVREARTVWLAEAVQHAMHPSSSSDRRLYRRPRSADLHHRTCQHHPLAREPRDIATR